MTILIVPLLLAITGTTFTVAQEGTVPKETCQFLIYDLKHRFLNDPNIDTNTLKPSNETLERLKQFITSEERCSFATDVTVFEVKYKKSQEDGIPAYTETIKLQVSANTNITKPDDRVEKLTICLDDVINTVGEDSDFENSLQLNVSGELKSGDVKIVTVGQKSCCNVTYGFPESVDKCCRPGFIEDGDNCGQDLS